MKKLLIGAALVLGFASSIIAFSIPASAVTTDQLKRACQNAFEGKCLHGGAVDTSNFYSVDNILSYCAPGATFCSDTECTTRLKVITNLGGLAVDNTGNPCLP